MPEVSVVIPSYNHAEFIGEAVRSVLAQSQADLELLVVDDGSTDRTLEVLNSFADRRLHIIEQSNRGAHTAINRGLEQTSGRYVAILNSDDVYHPRRLERTISFLEANEAVGLVGSHIEVIDDDGTRIGVKHGYEDLEPWPLEERDRSFRAGSDLRGALLTENYLATTSNFVFRRRLWNRVGGFRRLRFTHDWDYALRSARHTRLALLPESLLQYRVHPGNTIRVDQAVMIFEICWCLATHLPQHVSDGAWFGQSPLPDRVDQLLHSIHTFGCDDVLCVLLLQEVSRDQDGGLQLLDPDDPCRAIYLDLIERRIAKGSDEKRESLLTQLWARLRTVLRK